MQKLIIQNSISNSTSKLSQEDDEVLRSLPAGDSLNQKHTLNRSRSENSSIGVHITDLNISKYQQRN